MKRIGLMAGILLGILLASVDCPAEGVNLVANGGMEENLQGELPSGWSKHQQGEKWVMQAAPDEQTKHSGLRSIRLESPQEVRGGIKQEGIPVQGGRDYSLQFWARSEDLEGSAEGAAAFLHFDRGPRQYLDLTMLKGTQDWKLISKKVSVPAGAAKLSISFEFYNSKGKIWIDDVELTILPLSKAPARKAGPNPLTRISDPLFRELLTDASQSRPVIATSGRCMDEAGTPDDVKQNPRWREDMAEELLSARINAFIWQSGPYMDFLAKHGFKALLWIGFHQAGLGADMPLDSLYAEESVRQFEETVKAQVKNAGRHVAGVLFGDEQEGSLVDIYFNDPDPLKRLAVREANAEKFLELGRRFYSAVKSVSPEMPVISNNLCMIWYPLVPMDYSRYGEAGDIISYDAYPTPREARRKGSAAFMPGFGAKFLSDMTGKPVWGILQAFEYHKHAPHPLDVQEYVSQLFRNGGEGLLWYDHTFPHVPGSFVKYQQPDVWDMEKRMSWMAASLPKLKLPQSSDTAMLYSQHSYAAMPGISRQYWNSECEFGVELYSAYALIGQKAGSWFTFICDRQLERGEKDLGKFKVLHLPLASYETEAVARQIKEYVSQGGTLVSGDPEVFSSTPDGKSLREYRKEIFGIDLMDKGSQHEAVWNGQALAFPPNQRLETASWKVEVVCPDAEVLAKFADGSPALVKRKLGKGCAYYFASNPFFPEVLGDAAWISLFKQMQSDAGCKVDEPIWRFLIPSGQAAFDKVAKIERPKMPDSLRNGGFEESEAGAAKEWFLSSRGSGKAEIDSNGPYEGKASLKLACEGKGSEASAIQLISVKPNADYVLRFRYRYSGGAGPLKIYDLFGKTFFVQDISTEWRPAEFTVNSGSREEATLNFLHYNRDNAVWIDNVEWSEAGK